MNKTEINTQATCYHCGEDCGTMQTGDGQRSFCCQGCKMVFEILNRRGMCDYYSISKHPGNSRKIVVREGKFAFLDEEKIQHTLVSYRDETQIHVCFHLPQMHCSSCLWLLENLHQLDTQIISSKVNFTKKEADIIFNHQHTSLRQVAELLSAIGYEPHISLHDMKQRKPVADRSKLYRLGVAGFCFANIMLLSFPEYLGIDVNDQNLILFFRYLNVVLSLPVVFYSASEFYHSAWKSIRHKFVNIDAPIVLAIWITFARSLYEVFTATGSGYFDTISGIVFFMLIGRVLQDKTYEQLSFDRDYTSYFPIAVTRIVNQAEQTVALEDIRLNDTVLIHNEELIPADGILTKGSAIIDYSFVTGESLPVEKGMGELVYAGGKQTGSNIEVLVIKEMAQSYLTKLWNRDELRRTKTFGQRSFVHVISRYFTWIVFAIAGMAALYWWINDPSKIWNSVTAVLIVACPCALLLSNTFTNGNILRLLSRNKFYLRNAQVIEDIADANHIVFDKTGTLTSGSYNNIEYAGEPLTTVQKENIAALASQSAHPLSRALGSFLDIRCDIEITCFKESPGKGIQGLAGIDLLLMGSKEFVLGTKQPEEETAVHVSFNGRYAGRFIFRNHYRKNVHSLVAALRKQFSLSVISGDNAGEKQVMREMMGTRAEILFNQKPEDKLEIIRQLQEKGKKVIMLGDGLNDAGALKQANVGIAVSDSSNNFTPASDAIVDASRLHLLHKFITLCRVNKRVVIASFIISIMYNVVGIYFSVQGNLSPMIAAILMPASSISIILIAFGISDLAAWKLGIKE